mmetsp:Transcript_119650/g.338736  ORF Transcript_119650/g.338736 Transcript_119650/m.338736 type:complete len:205 (-) Transcript_119650:45-659(-)
MELFARPFRAAVSSHLVCAAVHLLTDPCGRWNGHQHLRLLAREQFAERRYTAMPAPMAIGSKVVVQQVAAADRQVAAGFVAVALVLHRSEPLGPTGVTAAVVLLLWDGALLLNSCPQGWSIEEPVDWPSWTLQEWLLLSHAIVSVAGACIYLVHYVLRIVVVGCVRWGRAGRSRGIPSLTVASNHSAFITPVASAPPCCGDFDS